MVCDAEPGDARGDPGGRAASLTITAPLEPPVQRHLEAIFAPEEAAAAGSPEPYGGPAAAGPWETAEHQAVVRAVIPQLLDARIPAAHLPATTRNRNLPHTLNVARCRLR